MSQPYAHNTKVPVYRSREEIVGLIGRFGVANLATGTCAGRDFVMFDHKGQTYRFVVEPQDDPSEERRRWRCIVMYIKSALVFVQEGQSDIESVFMAHRILPNGQTWGEFARDNNAIPTVSEFPQLGTDREH